MADFTNIDGVYAKDTELRSGIDTLRTTVLSNTIKPLTVTKNDTYTAIPSSGTYGYSPITVDVQEEPWEPLEDGYSNFWFELTNDTLSPWLNFSAKNNDATIDWGDGSGEVALDTLTPTHTYSKAGKYVVKVKGVTRIARQITANTAVYSDVLQGAELSNEISGISEYAFWECIGLKNVVFLCSNLVSISNYSFSSCGSLRNVVLPENITALPTTMFYRCASLSTINIPTTVTTIAVSVFRETALRKIVLPASITSLDSYTFMDCAMLSEIHCQATIPPTVGTDLFKNIPPNYIIYVPVGTAETYKSAAGWSTYADHIVEEGQSLSKSQLRAIAEEQKKSDNGEEMR